jgi:replication factor C large subunit
MWTEKYKPKSLGEIVGNSTLIKHLTNYNWKRPLLLYGSTGIGKSVLIEAFARDYNFDIIQMTDENLDRAKEISQTQSLFGGGGRRRLLLFDNVEVISDIKKVTEFLKETKEMKVPTVLITSDFKSKRLTTIKRLCEKVQMRKPLATTIANILEKICEKEKVKANKEILLKIAENSGGDVRASILDLETIAKGKSEIKGEEDLEILEMRDKISDIYKALNLILVKKDIREAMESTYDLTEQPRDVLLWLDENLPKIFSGKEYVEKGFHHLSRADIFLGRITRRQYWGFLRYANALMTAGVNISKGERINFSRYQFPFYIIHMAQTKKERNIKKSIAEKLSSELHASSRIINKEYIPLFKILLKHKKITQEELSEKFKFNDEELEFLKK